MREDGGENIVEKLEKAMSMNETNKKKLDVVLIRGPANSLVERGLGGERVLKATKRDNGEEEWMVKYHLTDPVKITMAENVELVDRMVKFVGEVTETVGDEVRVMNVMMLPRFVKTCCREPPST